MNKKFKEYKTGIEAVDKLILELASNSGPSENEELRREMLTSIVKLGLESHDRGDLKMVNTTVKELRYSFKIFSHFRNQKKVIIFGSARTKKTAPAYKMAEELAQKLTAKDYMVVTGGGPGIMEAGNKGAAPGKDFALNIKLPFEQKGNPFLDEKEKIINFKYFFVRKLIFIKETDATTLFPGGFGTHDEGFEMLTLVQTGKSKPRPIILMEPKGSTYWKDWKGFVQKQLVKEKFINASDMSLFQTAQTADEAVKMIDDFYKIYHSIRYVGAKTILRLKREISEETLKKINREFKDILIRGKIESTPPAEEEVKESEHVDLPRLSMNFNLHNYSRLCEMIRVINKDIIKR
jgi:uncharacterized protein (TIGR00730 family)